MKSIKQDRIVTAGTEEEYEEVKILLAKAGLEERIIGRVAIDEKNNLEIIDLNSSVKSGKITEIIFCQGDLSFFLYN